MFFRGRRAWAVKDPLALRYFHLYDEEHFLLQQLDGRTSLDELCRRFEREFAPRTIQRDQLHGFLKVLHDEGLVVADGPQAADVLLDRRRQQQRRDWLARFTNLLAIRFPGIDPGPLLDRLYPACRWLFSPLSVSAVLLLILMAALLVAVRLSGFSARLPDFDAFFTLRNVFWLVVILAGMKVLHELGHALTCRHFGGSCPELGLMLLAFAPCLYCNVSDAWMFRSKWQRIAVSAAGMYVELLLASLATFLWWFSEPGLLNTLCLNVMFLGSVNTVLLNGNPLLRFDGYFVLADLAEVPNLRQQATAVLHARLARWLARVELAPERSLAPQGPWWLGWYAAAAAVYTWVVVGTILYLGHVALRPYHLERLAEGLALLTLLGLALPVIVRAVRYLRNPLARRRMSAPRLAVSCTLGMLALAAAFWVPLPRRVSAPVVIEPRGAVDVYVTAPGTLQWVIRPGAMVRRGDVLARLADPELDRELLQLALQRDQQALHLKHLLVQQVDDPQLAPRIPGAKERLADLAARLEARRQDRQRLTIRAPQAGTVLSPPYQAAKSEAGRLPTWSGSPLDERNRGCYLEPQTILCRLGDPRQVQALATIDEADIEHVRVGQRVQLVLAQWPGQRLSGKVEDIAEANVAAAPPELVAAGDLATREGTAGDVRPASTSYHARIVLDSPPVDARLGGLGRARIQTEPVSLGRRLQRYLSHTFRFRW